MRKLLMVLRVALLALTRHKTRSVLTMLGVVFGVGSVVAMLSVGEGASKEALEQIKKLGSNNIIISSMKSAEGLSRSLVACKEFFPGAGLYIACKAKMLKKARKDLLHTD